MVFNDIVNLISADMESLKELDNYIEAVKNVVKVSRDINENIFYFSINEDSKSIDCYQWIRKSEELPSKVRKELKKIKIFDVMNIIQSIEKSNRESGEVNYIFNEFLCNLKNSCEKVYEYLSLSDNEQKKELLNLMNYYEELIKQLNFLDALNKHLKTFNTYLETNYEINENEKVFLIQLHNKDMTLQEITSCIQIIDSLYERACNMFKISTQDFKLKPIKLESGSLLEKVFGHEKIFDFLDDLLNRTIGFIYRNYTNEGKIKGQTNKIDLMKEQLNLIEMCEQHGIDTTEAKETFEGNLNAMCHDVCKLTTKSQRITVNERTYDQEQELNERFLEEFNMIGIEETKKVVLKSNV